MKLKVGDLVWLVDCSGEPQEPRDGVIASIGKRGLVKILRGSVCETAADKDIYRDEINAWFGYSRALGLYAVQFHDQAFKLQCASEKADRRGRKLMVKK